jgi:hypothetical protein
MGHIRLGKLPLTRRWREVLELLDGEGDISSIANASLEAAQAGLKAVTSNPGFIYILTSIFQFLDSASAKDFVAELRNQGYSLPDEATLFDVISGFKSKLDSDLTELLIKSDVSELAQNAFSEVLFKYASIEIDSLFETTPEIVQKTIAKFSSGNRLRGLMHEFFTSFISHYLFYYLSRELSNHVGHDLRFENIDSHREFNTAIDLYIRQSVRITDEFVPGWFGKARYEQDITPESVSRFAFVAFKKIREQFARGG